MKELKIYIGILVCLISFTAWRLVIERYNLGLALGKLQHLEKRLEAYKHVDFCPVATYAEVINEAPE